MKPSKVIPCGVATILVTGSKFAKAVKLLMSRSEQGILTEKGVDFLLKMFSDAPSRTKEGTQLGVGVGVCVAEDVIDGVGVVGGKAPQGWLVRSIGAS